MPRVSVGVITRTSFYPWQEESEEKIWEDDEFENVEKDSSRNSQKNDYGRDKF